MKLAKYNNMLFLFDDFGELIASNDGTHDVRLNYNITSDEYDIWEVDVSYDEVFICSECDSTIGNKVHFLYECTNCGHTQQLKRLIKLNDNNEITITKIWPIT